MKKYQISGVFPEFAVQAGTQKPRSELGLGALMPWAGKLWVLSYIAHTGHNSGLYSLDSAMNFTRHPESISGTYANRFAHAPSDSIIIGPHIVDGQGKVRTSRELAQYRLAGTCQHLEDPENKVYMLTMEGPFFEWDLNTMRVREICNLSYELRVYEKSIAGWTGLAADPVPQNQPQPHFKACHTAQGRVYVVNNSYFEPDYRGEFHSGRLAEWDGREWKVVRQAGFNEVTGRENFGGAVFAVGWDRASTILMVRQNGGWKEYRLPKASQTFEHCWQAEWPRLREVQHERFMLNAGGMFYEMSGWMPDGELYGIRPVCSHLRVVSDYASFAGLLVMGDNQVSPVGNNWTVGEPQSNLWFGHIEDLWKWGKPKGWGGPWYRAKVQAGEASAPYLLTGFDKKSIHLRNESEASNRIQVQVDFAGDDVWSVYEEVPVEAKGYACLTLPDGFSAHWVRFVSAEDSRMTAHLHYT